MASTISGNSVFFRSTTPCCPQTQRLADMTDTLMLQAMRITLKAAYVRGQPFSALGAQWCTTAVFLIEFAVFIPLTYLSSSAISTGAGLPSQTAYRLIALLNVGSVPGRALPGYFTDRFGRFNVMIVTAAVCTILIFGIWMPPIALHQANEAALTVFAVLFGFWSGAAISLTPVCIAQVSKVEEVGRKVGTSFAVASIGALVGVPIGGAIVDASGGGFTGLTIFSGAFYVLALGGFVVARFVASPERVGAIF